MVRSGFLRARRPEHKEQRRQAIRAAARDLACASGVRSVTLSAVAEAADLAKSNIVRYFGSREEIYLDLLGEEWRQWAQAVSIRLSDAGGTAEAVAALAETIVDRPLFCDLLSHASTTLEHNVSVAAARTLKHTVHDLLAEMGAEVARATELTEREGRELVVTAGGLAGMLYAAANPPPALAQVYADDPDLEAFRPTLLPTLVRVLSALAAGLPTLRQDSSPKPSAPVPERGRSRPRRSPTARAGDFRAEPPKR